MVGTFYNKQSDDMTAVTSEVQSTPIISNCNGLSEILRDNPYLDISELQNWGKNKSNNHILQIYM